MKIKVNPEEMKKAVATVKLIKPVMQEYQVRFLAGCVAFSSFDRRRTMVAFAKADSDQEIPGEFYIPLDRVSIFDNLLEKCEFSVTDSAVKLSITGDSTTKTASLKKRNLDNKRQKIIYFLPQDSTKEYSKRGLLEILDTASASSLIKESKTDEDMKINKIFFDSTKKVALSASRFFASIATSEKILNDLQIVSADVPIMNNFLAKCPDKVILQDDKEKYYLVDPESNAYVSFNKMGDLKTPDSDSMDFKGVDGLSISIDTLRELMKWAQLSLEGTQRFTLKVDAGTVSLWSGKNELISKSIDYVGSGFKADFPLKIFASLVNNLPDSDLRFEWEDAKYPGLVGFRTTSDVVNSIHLTRTMKEK